MWFKCNDTLPKKNGTYMTAECGFMGNTIYRIARFNKNLGSVFGLEEHEGKSGFMIMIPNGEIVLLSQKHGNILRNTEGRNG